MPLKAADALLASFQGINTGPGPISLPGARVGDFITTIEEAGNFQDFRPLFEQTISVDDEIQQTATAPLAANTFTAVLVREIAVS